MQITTKKCFTKQEDGTYIGHTVYRLTKSYRDSDGQERKAHVLYLGGLEGLTRSDRMELASMLTQMIEQHQAVISDNAGLYEMAMDFYLKYRETRYAQEDDPVLKAEAERRERERRRDLVTIRLSSLVQKQARTIGPEAVCRSTLSVLKLREFLNAKGWSREQVDLALMQIIARAIYQFSELKTVRCLRDNSALLEMFRLDRSKVTKDALYRSAVRLWDIHREMEDFLHERVRSMFNLYNVIRTVEETFHTLKSDLDMRPVYHKSDNGIKAHMNLAVLAYWIVSVTKYRLKLKEYPNVRWDEIMRIAQAQVVVTAEMDTEDGNKVSVRQSTEAEDELAVIYSLLEVKPNPIGKVKSVVPLKAPRKNPPLDDQKVT